MKKVILIGFLMVLVVAPGVMADQVYYTRLTGYYAGNGGEFTIIIQNNNLNPDLNFVLPYYSSNTKDQKPNEPRDDFQTFCVERSEYVSGSGPYDFAISNSAKAGGNDYGNNTPGYDPLSKGAAWLYHQFQLGTLEGYDYTAGTGRAVDAGNLQNTIWWLEDELATEPVNEFTTLVKSKFSANNDYKNDNDGYPVAVLNLYYTNGSAAQDQLVCVPEPASFLLLGLGLLGVGVFARRRFKK